MTDKLEDQMNRTSIHKVTDTETLAEICEVSRLYKYKPIELTHLREAIRASQGVQVGALKNKGAIEAYLVLEVMIIDDDLPIISVDDYGHNLEADPEVACYWATKLIDKVAQASQAYQTLWGVCDRNTPLINFLKQLEYRVFVTDHIKIKDEVTMSKKHYDYNGSI